MSLQEYRPPANLQMIWSPPDALEAAHDAELHALADRVIAAYGQLPELSRYGHIDNLMPFILDLAAIRHALTIEMQPPIHAWDWPDPAAELLAAWPAPIVMPAVCP